MFSMNSNGFGVIVVFGVIYLLLYLYISESSNLYEIFHSVEIIEISGNFDIL